MHFADITYAAKRRDFHSTPCSHGAPYALAGILEICKAYSRPTHDAVIAREMLTAKIFCSKENYNFVYRWILDCVVPNIFLT